jgi:hypothetical protein
VKEIDTNSIIAKVNRTKKEKEEKDASFPTSQASKGIFPCSIPHNASTYHPLAFILWHLNLFSVSFLNLIVTHKLKISFSPHPFLGMVAIGLPPQLLPLHLVHKVEVRLIKVVHTNITVLSARGIRGTSRVNGNGV